jgi:hypothetical protein
VAAVTAVEELVQLGKVRNISATLPVGDVAWREWPDLMRQVRSDFTKASVTKLETTRSSHAYPFLFAVLSASRGRGGTRLQFFHNAKPYQLECEKTPDRRAGENFSARHLTVCPQSVVRMACQIYDLTEGRTSIFKLWMDQSSPLPIRIEFSPKVYLRIALEFDPTLELEDERRTHAEK